MKSTDLRQLIRESIQEYIREIDAAGDRAALEAKMKACEEAIALREKKSNMDGLDEAYHDMLDKGKIGELKKEIKALGKTLEKYKKQLAKMDGKNEPKKEKEDKEVIDETPEITAEVDMNEYTADSELEEDQLAEAKKKKKKKEEKEEKEELNESFLHMQKLAGLITEGEYKEKVDELFGLFKKTPYEGLKKAKNIRAEEYRTMYLQGGEKEDKSYGSQSFSSYSSLIQSVPNKYETTWVQVSWDIGDNTWRSVNVSATSNMDDAIKSAVEKKYGEEKE
jgi:hypothetical protein